MAGGGTGGHVIPGLAVAKELRARGHEPFFVGTQRGIEAKLVPADGFPIEWIEIGGLNRVAPIQRIKTLAQLPISILKVMKIIKTRKTAAVFCMGGYVAGPPVLAARLKRVPVVLMEPDAQPGMTNRRIGGFAARALISFPEAARWFPQGRTELTGLPVRDEFFHIPPKTEGPFTVLITGGSRGARSLNQAVHASWSLFKQAGEIRILHQCGTDAYETLSKDFAATGLEGEVVPFYKDMPAAFAQADLVVCRSGAGAVAELAAAGKPAILVPFPYAANDHQLRNAESMARAGAARLVQDKHLTPGNLFQEIEALAKQPERLKKMGEAAKALGKPGAARRAADILEEVAGLDRRK